MWTILLWVLVFKFDKASCTAFLCEHGAVQIKEF